MGPKPVAQEVPRVMANMLAPSSAPPLPAGTMRDNGVPTFPAPLLPVLSCSSPFVLLGKVGEAKSWQLPTRKTPVCKEAVLNKSQRSRKQKQVLPPPARGWKTHVSLCSTLGNIYPIPLRPAEPVLSVLCCDTSHTTTSAFRSQRAREDQACHNFFFPSCKVF